MDKELDLALELAAEITEDDPTTSLAPLALVALVSISAIAFWGLTLRVLWVTIRRSLGMTRYDSLPLRERPDVSGKRASVGATAPGRYQR